MGFRPPSEGAVTPGGHGRFPDFDVLGQTRHWDEVTASVVLRRLQLDEALAFFTPEEGALADALFSQLLGQHEEPRVPVLLMVDERLALGQTDGWHHEDMPEDAPAWRRTLRGLTEDAHDFYDREFVHLAVDEQARLIQRVHDLERWRDLPGAHVWSLWTRYAATAFYAHPWAWNEIGFGGPAYPRGYGALGVGQRESWEVADHDDVDPVTFTSRIERARRRHDERGRPA